jgi:outer membrane receptor protein involved in Fe transport
MRFLLVALLVLTWSLTASPASASGSADEAEVQFQLGNDAFDQRQYHRALSHFFASHRLAANRNVLVNIALCYQGMRSHVEAYRYFTESLHPDMAQADRKAIEKVRDKARKHIAVLNITSDPPGATIYIGRKDLGAQGQTPRSLPVAPTSKDKPLVVIIESPHYKVAKHSVRTLQAGDQRNVSITLQPRFGDLVLEGSPDDFEVQVDGQPAGQAAHGKVTLQVPAGQRTITLTAPGYLPSPPHEIKITQGKPVSMAVDLRSASGAIVVNSEESGAKVSVDGEVVGFAPTVVDPVSAGRHVLTISKAGFRTDRRTITLRAKERLQVVADLEVEDTVQGVSGVRESVLNAPASVSLITAREIGAFGYTTVADALVGTRGMFITNDRTYIAPGVRGYSPFGQYGNRVQVLLDGHRINDDWLASSFISYDLIATLHDIEKIEIIRGPGSAVYGSGAFFGVINLVTPRAVDGVKTSAGLSMIGDGGLRAYGKFEAPLGRDGGVRLYAGGLYRQPGDYLRPKGQGNGDSSTSPAAPTEAFLAQGVGEEYSGSFLLKAWLGDFTLKAGFNDRTQQVPTGAYETIFGDSRTQVQDDRFFAELMHAPKLSDKLTLSSRLFFDSFGYTGQFAYEEEDDGLMKEHYRGYALGTEVRTDYTPAAWSRFTLGGEYQFHFKNQAQGSSEAGLFLDEKHPYHSAAAFAIANIDLFDWWSIQAGARLDATYVSGLVPVPKAWTGPVPKDSLQKVCERAKPEGPDFEERDVPFVSLNPRVAMRFTPSSEGTLKLMFGRAFRAASIYELTYNDGCLTQSPSPGLTEEAVYTGDIEYIHKFEGGFWLTLSTSLSVVENGIHQRETSEPIEVDGEENMVLYYSHLREPAHALSTEIEIRKEFRRGWMIAGHYGFQVTKHSVDGFLQGEDIPNAPVHLAGAKLVLPLFERRVRLASRIYVEAGRQNRNHDTLPATVLWDVMLSGELPALKMQYSAGIRNILNWDYSHPVGDELTELSIRQPGTSATLEMNFQF